jgi:hypothetical protein
MKSTVEIKDYQGSSRSDITELTDALFENQKKILEDFYESAKSICKRLNISKSCFFKLAEMSNVRRYRIAGTKLTRYRVKDILDLVKPD